MKDDVKCITMMRNQESFLAGDKMGRMYLWSNRNSEAPMKIIESHINYVRYIY